MSIKYFVFSTEQYNTIKNTEEKMGRIYSPGRVLVNGVFKNYTEIVNSSDNLKYSDATIVASGDSSQMTYFKPERKR